MVPEFTYKKKGGYVHYHPSPPPSHISVALDYWYFIDFSVIHPFWFLAQAFATAPRCEQRSQLLAIKRQTTDDDVPAIVFATTHSRKLLISELSREIFSNQHMLGPKWKNVNFLTAWGAEFKLGKSLTAFEYPKPIFKLDSTSKFGARSTNSVLNCSSTTVKRGNEPPAAACNNR
jgi:hypothetical protein